MEALKNSAQRGNFAFQAHLSTKNACPVCGFGIAHDQGRWCIVRHVTVSIGLSFLLLIACAPVPRVALEATPADLEMLAGQWKGEYRSAALGRSGTIEFELDAGTDEAFGAVRMLPRAPERLGYQAPAYRGAPDVAAPAEATELLTIRFIRAIDGSITGMLDRYWDPDRNCFATTVFRGYVGIGVVEGTFRTTFESGVGEATGEWRAAREKDKAK
jgi:hypothetical protein